MDAAGISRLDVRALAGAMAHVTPDLPAVAPADLPRLAVWIAPRAGDLPGALVDALARAPIWLDAAGVPRPLDALRRGTDSRALDALYEALGGRWVASAGALAFSRALGFPTNMFTVLFAVARTVGWIAQWSEMIEDPRQKIGRPRQLYTGAPQRDYVAASDRV